MNQTQLQQEYKKQIDLVNNFEFDENVKNCDVCGSDDLTFIQKENAVDRNCNDCLKFQKEFEN